jgi:hypothetical protein
MAEALVNFRVPRVSPPSATPVGTPETKELAFAVLTANPYDLEIGDVLLIGGKVAYKIKSIAPLYYQYASLGGIALSAGSSRTDTITDLKPEDDEIYWIDAIGIDGPVTVQPVYPQGNPRETPHNIAQFFDQTQGHKLDPFYVDLWVTPGTQPQLNLSMPSTSPSTTSDVWFYGRKFKFELINQSELNLLAIQGHRILAVSRVYE